MEWTHPIRARPVPSVIDGRGKMRVNPLKVKEKLIDRDGRGCSLCGGNYAKYLYFYHRNRNIGHNSMTNLLLSCRLCYLVTHLNSGFLKEMILCYSTLSQTEIIRKTVDYLLEHDEVPSPDRIDSKVMRLPLSLVEYQAVLGRVDKPFPGMENYKIFFSNYLDTSFLNQFQRETETPSFLEISDNCFIEEDELDEDEYYLSPEKKRPDLKLKLYTMTESEHRALGSALGLVRSRKESVLSDTECEIELMQHRIALDTEMGRRLEKEHRRINRACE